MAIAKGWKIGLVGVGLVVALLLAQVLARPAMLDEDRLRARMTELLSEWTGGQVAISGDIEVHYFPGIAIQAENVSLAAIKNIPNVQEINAKGLRAEVGLASLLAANVGFHTLVLFEPRMTVHLNRPSAGSPEAALPRLMAALQSTPVSAIELRNGRLTLSGAGPRETFEAVTARIGIARAGAVSGRGSFQWRTQPVAFQLSTGTPEINAPAAAKLDLSVSNELIKAEFEGRAAFSDGLLLRGGAGFRISDTRKFARWMGLLLPEGPGLGPFSASGAFEWQGATLALNDGSFALDGNKALGALALRISGARPQLTGTLALHTLSLAPYLPARNKPSGAHASPPLPATLNFPLLHHLDADLRLSSTRLEAPPLSIGQTAITVAVRGGRFGADAAVLDFCGGNGNARIGYDAADPTAPMTLTGTLSGLSVRRCADLFGVKIPLSGRMNVTVDLESAGRTGSELFRKLGGTAAVSVGEGTADLDIPKLLHAAAAGPVQGWDKARGRGTAFTAIEGRFVLRPGEVYSDSLRFVSLPLIADGEGRIDTRTGALDWRVQIATGGGAPPRASAAPALPPAVLVQGGWDNPAIVPESARASHAEPRR